MNPHLTALKSALKDARATAAAMGLDPGNLIIAEGALATAEDNLRSHDAAIAAHVTSLQAKIDAAGKTTEADTKALELAQAAAAAPLLPA